MTQPRAIALAFFLCTALSRVEAACPDDQTERCLMGNCICVPDELDEASTRVGALLLEQWLIESRDKIVASARPIPADIRAKLKSSVDAKVLDAARYRIDDGTAIDLASLNLVYGDLVGSRIAAVTLIDVIVFRDAKTASDSAVWAHELFHVKQFREWGVHEFAMRYARDFHQVEDPAYAFQAAHE